MSGLLGGWQIKDKESNETVAGGYELVVGSGHRNEEMFWTEDKDAFGAGSLTSGAIWGSSQDNKDVIYWKDEENKIHATTGSYETEHNWS